MRMERSGLKFSEEVQGRIEAYAAEKAREPKRNVTEKARDLGIDFRGLSFFFFFFCSMKQANLDTSARSEVRIPLPLFPARESQVSSFV